MASGFLYTIFGFGTFLSELAVIYCRLVIFNIAPGDVPPCQDGFDRWWIKEISGDACGDVSVIRRELSEAADGNSGSGKPGSPM